MATSMALKSDHWVTPCPLALRRPLTLTFPPLQLLPEQSDLYPDASGLNESVSSEPIRHLNLALDLVASDSPFEPLLLHVFRTSIRQIVPLRRLSIYFSNSTADARLGSRLCFCSLRLSLGSWPRLALSLFLTLHLRGQRLERLELCCVTFWFNLN